MPKDVIELTVEASQAQLVLQAYEQQWRNLTRTEDQARRSILAAANASKLQEAYARANTIAIKQHTLALLHHNAAQRAFVASRGQAAGSIPPQNIPPQQVQPLLQNVLFNQRIKNAAIEARNAMIKTSDAASTLGTRIAYISDASDKAQKHAHLLHLTWSSLARILVVHLTYRAVSSFISGIAIATKRTAELRKSIAEIETISQRMPLHTEGWFKGITDLSGKYGLDTLDIAEAAYQTLSNQIAQGADSFQFLDSASKLAITSVSTLTDSVNALSSVINAYNVDMRLSDDISAKLFKTVELGRLRLSDMADSLGEIHVLANKLGVPLEDLLALIATLTIQGINYSKSNTQIKNLFVKMIKPTKELAAFIRELGFESGEAALSTLGLGEFLARLEERTRGSSTELAKQFNNIRGLIGVMAAMGNGAKIYSKNQRELLDANASYFTAHEKILKSEFQIIRQEVAKAKVAFIDEFGKPIVKTIAWMSTHFISFKETISITAGVLRGVLSGFATFAIVNILYVARAMRILNAAVEAHPLGVWTSIAAILAFIAQDAIIQWVKVAEREKDILEDIVKKNLEINEKYVAESIKQARKLSDEIENNVSRVASIKLSPIYIARKSLVDDIETIDKKIKSLGTTIAQQYTKKIKDASDSVKDFNELFEKTVEAHTELITKKDKLIFEAQLDIATPERSLDLIAIQINDLKDALATETDPTRLAAGYERIYDLVNRAANISSKAEENNKKAREEGLNLQAQIAKLQIETSVEEKRLREDINKAHKAGEFAKEEELRREYQDLQRNAQYEINSLKEKQRTLVTYHAKRIDLQKELSRLQEEAAKRFEQIEADAQKRRDEATAKETRLQQQKAELDTLKETYSDLGIALREAIATKDETKILEALKRRQIATDQYKQALIDLGARKLAIAIEDRQTAEQEIIIGRINEQRVIAARELAKQRIQELTDIRVHLEENIGKLADSITKIENARRAGQPVDIELLTEMRSRLTQFEDSKIRIIAELKEAGRVTEDFLDKSSEASKLHVDAIIEDYTRLIDKINELRDAYNALNDVKLINPSAPLTKASGGLIQRGIDTIPALLSQGEFVVNRTATRRFYSQLMAMNSLDTGGRVSNTSIGDINLSLNATGNTQVDINNIGQALRRAIKRGTLSLT